MAFLDNSGDIILDAVLTDTGRMRLAQGDGSFKISKFALGDDEINYELYNKSHASGSAYYDLEVLQTPVLEAFTNNASSLKSKLISLSRTNVLYMPILKLNKNDGGSDTYQANDSRMFARSGQSETAVSDEKFYICVDEKTWNAVRGYRKADNSQGWLNSGDTPGMLIGFHRTQNDRQRLIRVDQGLDTNEISPSLGLDSDLYESAYIVEMDYRLGRVRSYEVGSTAEAVNFIDDDNIASYYLTNNKFINPTVKNGFSSKPADAEDANGSKKLSDLEGSNPQVFEGPRGSTLHFRIMASQELQDSTYLFTQIGNSELSDSTNNILGFRTSNADDLIKTATTYWIDSTIRVIGANTGYRLDIPVRYIKVDY